MTAAPQAWQPLMVAVAPNGARKTAADHPALPITPAELARTAADCGAAGAAMIHLHVRDRDGKHTLDVEAYRAAIAAVRAAVGQDMVIQATSESVGLYKPAEQMAMVRELRPEAVSLAVREILPDQAAEPVAAEFLAWLHKERILPQYILYSAEDVARFADLAARGIVPGERQLLLYVLGRYSKDQQSLPADLLPFLAAQAVEVPAGRSWSVCAFGRHEAACALAAATLGGHVRVGFENNLLLPDGRVAPDNAALVAGVAAGAAVIGRPLADADQARQLMGA